MSGSGEACSRRERNRLDTWHAIHAAAYEQAVGAGEGAGPAAVTVEAIAEAAGVSRRTFFNYFASKEDAILGLRRPEIDAAALEAFRTGTADLLTRTVHLLAGTLLRTPLDDSAARRRDLIRRFPDLRERGARLVASAEAQVTQVLREDPALLGEEEQRNPQCDGDAPPPILLLAGAITRYAISRSSDADFRDVETSLHEAIQLFRTIAADTDNSSTEVQL